MLLYLLFSNIAHFGLTLFAALTFLATGLLYFDSRNIKKQGKSALTARALGFFLLSITYIFYATSISSSSINLLIQITKVLGLTLILGSLISEPILPFPKKSAAVISIPILLPALTYSLSPLSATLFLIIALVYFRKSNEGLEKQLRPASISFLLLAAAEALKILFAWSSTTNVFWSKTLAQFGTIWNISDILTFIGLLILAAWVWGYIRFRLQIQIFVITLTLTMTIFISVTFFFTYLLLNNLQNNTLNHLQTDSKVIRYAIDNVRSKTQAFAQEIADDANVKTAFLNNDKATLYNLSDQFMANQKTTNLVIADTSGQVLVRGENKGLPNDNVSAQAIVQAAINGQSVSTVTVTDGVNAPNVSITSAVPIINNNPVGVVTTSLSLDNSFVDGIKNITGLESTIFAGKTRSATTFISEDGKSRYTGTVESNPKVTDTVINKSTDFVGTSDIFNEPFYVAYTPLRNYENQIIGMIFVGEPESTLTASANTSIKLTFEGSTLLLVISLIPAYMVSDYIQKQLEA